MTSSSRLAVGSIQRHLLRTNGSWVGRPFSSSSSCSASFVNMTMGNMDTKETQQQQQHQKQLCRLPQCSYFSTSSTTNNNNKSDVKTKLKQDEIEPSFTQKQQQQPSDSLQQQQQQPTLKSNDEQNDSGDGEDYDEGQLPELLQKTVYVHPLSQIILEYLQTNYNDWIVDHGLDRLTIHRDGTFELKFCPKQQQDKESSASSKHNSSARTKPMTIGDRIWTSYDEQEKKHWLTVYKTTANQHGGDGSVHVHERYLLQDNLYPTWSPNKSSFPRHVHETVDSMVRAIDRTLSLHHSNNKNNHDP